MSSLQEAVIVAAARTGTGKFLGSLKGFTAPQLGALVVAEAVRLGGHVRVGLEDNLYLDAGVLAPDNAALVRKAVSVIEGEGARPASAAEARALLGLSPRGGAAP